ncbi:MAG TPA: hypothetical protein VFH73_16880 [Polyangia bacterium]|nr:hypothetical protein [Polyangia bacterium]
MAWPSVASAQKKRIGVAKFNGQQEAVVRNRVMQALRFHGFDLVKSREIENAAKSLGISLDSNDSFKALAKELALSAILTGDVGKKKAKLTVRGGNDGAVSGEGAFTGANPAKIATDTTKTFWRKLGPAISRGKPPAGAKAPSKAAVAEAPEDKEEAAPNEPEESDDKPEAKEEKAAAEDKGDKGDKADKGKEEEKVAESEDDQPKKKKKKKKKEADADEDSGPSGPLPMALDAEAGGRFFSRKLSYNQDINKSLRQYELKLASALGAAFVWFPAAHGSSGFIANVGLDISVEQAFGITSKLGVNSAYPTVIHDYTGGVRVRFPLGPASLGVIAGFGEHAYKLASGPGADRTMLDLPDTIYRYVRLGTALRIPMGNKLALMAGGAYRLVLSPGQIKTAYFTRATVGGVDANAAIGYRITPSIEARAGFDLRRYFYSMHSRNGDRYVAGGAVDQYLTYTISLAFMLGGEKGDPADNAEKVARRHDDDEADDADKKDSDEDAADGKGSKRKNRG